MTDAQPGRQTNRLQRRDEGGALATDGGPPGGRDLGVGRIVVSESRGTKYIRESGMEGMAGTRWCELEMLCLRYGQETDKEIGHRQ